MAAKDHDLGLLEKRVRQAVDLIGDLRRHAQPKPRSAKRDASFRDLPLLNGLGDDPARRDALDPDQRSLLRARIRKIMEEIEEVLP